MGHKRNQADAAGHLSIIYQQRQEYQSAKEMAHRALQLFEEIEHIQGIAWQAGILGDLFCAEGAFECAEPMYRRCLTCQKSLGNDEACAVVHVWLGAMYTAWGRRYDAMLNWKQAQEMFRQLGQIEQAEDIQKMMASGPL
ncbi:MAG: hypothetical protein F4X75_14920 [Gemmatimonadetes bacterium]|nr:hypothetical protein [Gemmatimonadota bacterium]